MIRHSQANTKALHAFVDFAAMPEVTRCLAALPATVRRLNF